LNTFLANEDYNIRKAYVFSNERKVKTEGKIIYLPIYFIMFLQKNSIAIEKPE